MSWVAKSQYNLVPRRRDFGGHGVTEHLPHRGQEAPADWATSETCSGAPNSVSTAARMVSVVVSRVVGESRVCVMACCQS